MSRCVGDVHRFLDGSWNRRAALHRGEDYADVLSLRHVDHILSTMALRAPAFRLVKAGATLPRSAFTRPGRIGSRDVGDLIDAGRVYGHFEDGATIVLQGLHRYWPPVTAFCRDLERFLTHPVQANAYITPPAAQGLRVHADRHDVFALQIHGRKQWVLYGDRSADLTLGPGDCLYVPTGTRHAARTVDTTSIHLTIGIRSITWAQVLRRVADAALADPALAESLPPGFANDPQALADAAQVRMQRLADEFAEADPGVAVDTVAERFWAGRIPVLAGQLEQLLAVDDVTDGDVVAVRPHVVAHLRRDGTLVRLVLGDRELRLPPAAEPALRTLLERGRLRVSDLSVHLDASSRLVLVRRLIREGLLTSARVASG